MNILCKILGHKMVFRPIDIRNSWCKRKSCGHTHKMEWPDPPPMPKCKPPKKEWVTVGDSRVRVHKSNINDKDEFFMGGERW